MVKITDALVTVEDVNGMLLPIGTAPVNSNRLVVKDQNFVGASPYTVGVNNNWKVDTTASPYSTYSSNRNPRYQDLLPLVYACNDGIMQNGYAGADFYTYPNESVSTGTTARVLLYWEVYDRPNIISVYDSTGLIYTTGWVGYATYTGPWGPSLNTATSGSIQIQFASTTGRYVKVEAGPANPSNVLTDSYAWSLACITTTTTSTSTTTSTTSTTTTTLAYDLYFCGTTTPASLRMVYDGTLSAGDIVGGINGYCYTVAGIAYNQVGTLAKNGEFSTCESCNYYFHPTTTTTTTCNPTPNWQNTGAYYCYGTCNTYYEQQDQNPCSATYGTTRQGELKDTNTTYCGGCCGQSTAPVWTNNGAQFCGTGTNSCILYQPQKDTNVCSSTYGTTQNVSLGNNNSCGTWTTSYYCGTGTNSCTKYSKETNSCTGDIRNVNEVATDSTYCGGCCGQSTAANWVNINYSCYNTCNKYNVQQDQNSCSPTYGNTQQGSVVQTNSTYCYIAGYNCCGQSTTPNWVNQGTAYCGTGINSCNLYQVQKDTNVCSSTYNTTQTVNLGVNSTCGIWATSYYCEPGTYNYYSKETNSCTNAVRNVTLVETNSPNCGYSPCTIYNIYAYAGDSTVTVNYVTCANVSTSTSFSATNPGLVGSLCVRNGNTPTVTNGQANITTTMCS